MYDQITAYQMALAAREEQVDLAAIDAEFELAVSTVPEAANLLLQL